MRTRISWLQETNETQGDLNKQQTKTRKKKKPNLLYLIYICCLLLHNKLPSLRGFKPHPCYLGLCTYPSLAGFSIQGFIGMKSRC